MAITTGGKREGEGSLETVKRSKPFKFTYEKEIVMSAGLLLTCFMADARRRYAYFKVHEVPHGRRKADPPAATRLPLDRMHLLADRVSRSCAISRQRSRGGAAERHPRHHLFRRSHGRDGPKRGQTAGTACVSSIWQTSSLTTPCRALRSLRLAVLQRPVPGLRSARNARQWRLAAECGLGVGRARHALDVSQRAECSSTAPQADGAVRLARMIFVLALHSALTRNVHRSRSCTHHYGIKGSRVGARARYCTY